MDVKKVKVFGPLVMRGWEEGLIPLVMWTWEDGPSIEQDLDDLVVVGVGGQDERRDVRGEGRGVRRDRLPTLSITKFMMMRMMIMMMMVMMM